MRRKPFRRGAVFAAVVGLGLTGLTVGSTITAPIALAQGANQSGPYDPTTPCTGDNQGNGNAPCNGSVGNADDKNPPGQLPGGSDSNNGYECDNNKGIGDNGGNPAHTGCVETEQEPGGPGGPGSSSVDTPEEEGEVLGETLVQSAPAAPVGEVEAATVTAPAPEVQAAAATAPTQLPFTGPGTLTTARAIVGSLMVLLGVALVRATSTKQPQFA